MVHICSLVVYSIDTCDCQLCVCFALIWNSANCFKIQTGGGLLKLLDIRFIRLISAEPKRKSMVAKENLRGTTQNWWTVSWPCSLCADFVCINVAEFDLDPLTEHVCLKFILHVLIVMPFLCMFKGDYV